MLPGLNLCSFNKLIPSAEVDVERPLEQLVRDEGDTELRGRATHSGDGALPERAETLLGVDLLYSVSHAVVRCLPAPRNHLQKRVNLIPFSFDCYVMLCQVYSRAVNENQVIINSKNSNHNN